MNPESIRRIAGGSEPAPREVRAAAIRSLTGAADETDNRLLEDYENGKIPPP